MQRTDPLDLLIGHWWLVGLISDGNGPLGCVKVERHSSQLTKGSQEEHRPVTMRQVSFRRPTRTQLRGGSMELLFTDGRLFTHVDLRFGSSHAEHWCGEDLQMIGTKILSESWIQERWSVHGPDTEFEATTDLFRSMNEEE